MLSQGKEYTVLQLSICNYIFMSKGIRECGSENFTAKLFCSVEIGGTFYFFNFNISLF